MTDRERKEMVWWLDEFSAGDQADKYHELFPEMNDRLWKYAVGVFVWNMEGLIDLTNPYDVSRVRNILKVIGSTPAFNFFDNVFNECPPEIVCEILGLSPKTPREEPPIKFDFTVHPIRSWEEAEAWHEPASWNFLISEEAFKSNDNRFYMDGNGEWYDVPCAPGANFPHDQFGYSLISIEVSPDDEIVSITSQWNKSSPDDGHFLTKEQLQSVLGAKEYDKLFHHRTENQ